MPASSVMSLLIATAPLLIFAFVLLCCFASLTAELRRIRKLLEQMYYNKQPY